MAIPQHFRFLIGGCKVFCWYWQDFACEKVEGNNIESKKISAFNHLL